MNTVCLLSHCGNHFLLPPFKGCVLNHPSVMSCLIWAIAVILIVFMTYCYLKRRDKSKLTMTDMVQKHEIAMKEKVFEQEKFWHEEKKKAKDEELTRKIKEYNELTKLTKEEELALKIKEFNELTIHLKILEKVTGVDKDIEDLKKALEEMKKKYESLDGEIEQIIIKKKQ